MWGSLLPVTVAVALTLAQRILTLTEIVDAWYAGLKQMLYALIILVLAWSLTSVVGGLQTASYLVSILGESLAPGMVPSMVFVLAAATAFATGSSWATMGILMPLVMPLVWAVLTAAGAQEQMHILYSAVSCVISGAVLGDHILAHLRHHHPVVDGLGVRSHRARPHAVALRADRGRGGGIGLGTLPAGFGLPWWLGMLAGGAAIYSILRYVGKPVVAAASAPRAPDS